MTSILQFRILNLASNNKKQNQALSMLHAPKDSFGYQKRWGPKPLEYWKFLLKIWTSYLSWSLARANKVVNAPSHNLEYE